ncbi:MAG: tetratricopeptide repeat protein [Blastocatellia bacterium]|nr:tetratricopeptide repeat protein [Blastocatellia bacterium]
MKRFIPLLALFLLVAGLLLAGNGFPPESRTQADNSPQPTADVELERQIESARYTREEFFGSQALVPLPTETARRNLSGLLAKNPQSARILELLAESDEKLGQTASAEKELEQYVKLEHESRESLEIQAAFFHRQTQFDREAMCLERMLNQAPGSERAELVERLLAHARTHNLDSYLKPEFYKQLIDRDPSVFSVFEQYINKLEEGKNYREALHMLETSQPGFPSHLTYFLTKRAELLTTLGQEKTAEQMFRQEIESRWSEPVADAFFEFLQNRNRFRAYGYEIKQAFRKNPGDFQLTIRLLYYLKKSYTSESVGEVIQQLERARTTKKQNWKPEELVTLSNYLLQNGYREEAIRYLYTLCLQGSLKPGDPVRAKVLYQLFQILMDAGNQRLSLTDGDVRFFRDIAVADSSPGLLGAVLSLVFADSKIGARFRQTEGNAVSLFNRATAYRIFSTYKQEYPTAPELAQMYLDIVRLYISVNDTRIAGETLAEFEKRYADAPEFPTVALKLADCYIALQQPENEQAVYQRILDYQGKNRKPGTLMLQVKTELEELTEVAPTVPAYPPVASNRGIALTLPESSSESSSENGESSETDSLVNQSETSYQTVLGRLVSSLAKQNRTQDILVLYGREIKKYPDEPGLYEHLLQWLGQTNFIDQQRSVYQEALKQFPTTRWQDRLARWLIRREFRQEFATYSHNLLASFNDAETVSYLGKFITKGGGSDDRDFDKNLYLGLYSLAHERFPHNLTFVNGLLFAYQNQNRTADWLRLTGEYYFESDTIRAQYLHRLAATNQLRDAIERARQAEAKLKAGGTGPAAALPYKLFRADAALRLSSFEEAVETYRELNRLYPNTPEFSERLVTLTRSFGQRQRGFLEEAAKHQLVVANANPASEEERTKAGEILAELGDYPKAKAEWAKLIGLASGDPETYLNTATLYWDYYQYDDALRTIESLREKTGDLDKFAFQAGAIYEAKHNLDRALAEYVKALNEETTEYHDRVSTKNRLAVLFEREGVPARLQAAFAHEAAQQNDASWLTLGFVEFLKQNEHWKEGRPLLLKAVAQSTSQNYLARARDMFVEAEDAAGETEALKKLIGAAKSPRFSISYRLQLADQYRKTKDNAKAEQTLRELLRAFPRNYGVISETAAALWRMHKQAAAIQVLQTAMRVGKGKYRYIFARKLVDRYKDAKQTAQAEKMLLALYKENDLDSDVFHELASLYVKTSQPARLQVIFKQTLNSIANQDSDIKEIKYQVADLRKEMIAAFTDLKDFDSAIEQHIEIINRNPEDETYLNAALEFTKRYGGGDKLLAYYQQTAAQAFKNYRWNLVLARIYEAKGDLPQAVQNYRTALANQPEMVDLHLGLASLLTRQNDFSGAVTALTKAAELSNDAPDTLKLLIAALEKAGRTAEADRVRARLPKETAPPLTLAEQMAAASRLRFTEKEKAVAAYRKVMAEIQADLYKTDPGSSDLIAYIETLRMVEPLPNVATGLWELRSRLIAEAERKDNEKAGKARDFLRNLDYAISEGIGKVAAERATGDELAGLESDIRERLATASQIPAQYGTEALLQNLCRRAGLVRLEEDLLVTEKVQAQKTDGGAYHNSLQKLMAFYADHGAFQKAIEVLQTEQKNNPEHNFHDFDWVLAQYARLLGNTELELQTLRHYYQTLEQTDLNQGDPATLRYFEMLAAKGPEGREEFRVLVENPALRHLQLVNFLISRGDFELARTGIDKASLPEAWRRSRGAEIGLALRVFTETNRVAFHEALQVKPIGAALGGQPDPQAYLVGDEWFALAQTYGQWAYLNRKTGVPGGLKQPEPDYLPALIENRPKDVAAQTQTARWYVQQKDAPAAILHYKLALEKTPSDKSLLVELGAAYLLGGDRQQAFETWEKLLGKNPSAQDCAFYLETLTSHGFDNEGRAKILPFLKNWLVVLNSPPVEGKLVTITFETVRPLLQSVALSFRSNTWKEGPLPPQVDTARVNLFLDLCNTAPKLAELPTLVIKNLLVTETELTPFYQLVIPLKTGLSKFDQDYLYSEMVKNTGHPEQLEEPFDHQTNFRNPEPNNERYTWQKEFVKYLFDQHQNQEAATQVASIESDLAERFPRPDWLRLARFRLAVRGGQVDFAKLLHFVGIETRPEINPVQVPNLVRLNDCQTMLRKEGFPDQADALGRAFHERLIALEQYDPLSFLELARQSFTQKQTPAGLKLLDLMLDLSRPETKAATEAQMSSLGWVQPRRIEATSTQKPAPQNSIQTARALQQAAELTTRFGLFEASLGYRSRLQAVEPENATNGLEKIRLLAATRKITEAIQQLAQILGDRQTTRLTRWTAVWLANDLLVGAQADRWNQLQTALAATGTADLEISTAASLLEQAATGRQIDFERFFSKKQGFTPTTYSEFLLGILKQKTNPAEALVHLARADAYQSQTPLMNACGFAQESPRRQLVRLYCVRSQPEAALKLASTMSEFQIKRPPVQPEPVESTATGESNDYQTPVPPGETGTNVFHLLLAERNQGQQPASNESLLRLLSQAAETIGDVDRAIGFEETRQNWLTGATAFRESNLHIVRLEDLRKKRPTPFSTPYRVTQQNVGNGFGF